MYDWVYLCSGTVFPRGHSFEKHRDYERGRCTATLLEWWGPQCHLLTSMRLRPQLPAVPSLCAFKAYFHIYLRMVLFWGTSFLYCKEGTLGRWKGCLRLFSIMCLGKVISKISPFPQAFNLASFLSLPPQGKICKQIFSLYVANSLRRRNIEKVFDRNLPTFMFVQN